MFSIFRHFLAVAIFCACGYAWQKHQAMTSPSEDQASESFDPFEEWDQYEEAPAFQGGSSSVEEFSQNEIPEPIPLPEDLESQLPTDLVSLGEAAPANTESTNSRIEQKSSEPRRSPRKSIWDDPSRSKAAESVSQQNQDKNVTKSSESSQTNEASSPLDHLARKTREGFQSLQNSLAETFDQQSSGRPASQQKAADTWRQYTIGSGQDRMICVIDHSISRNPQHLTALFSGLRQQWFTSSSSDKRLDLLIAHPDRQENFAGLQQRIRDVQPRRILYLTSGGDDRGRLRFSSDDESFDALMTAPGLYRVSSLSADEKKSLPPVTDLAKATVFMELPRPNERSEDDLVPLIHAALMGNWAKDRKNQAASPQTKADVPFNPFSNSAFETIENDVDELVESLPSPEEARTSVEEAEQQEVPRNEGMSRMSDPELPDSEDVLPQSEKQPIQTETPFDEYKTTDELIAGIFGKSQKENSESSKRETHERGQHSVRKASEASSPKVELLEPPPIFQSSRSESSSPTGKSFFRLPPPPEQ